MNFKHSCLAISAVLLLWGASVHADVQVSPLFGNNMVLQRNLAVPVWGTADAGESVAVSINGQTQKTVAGPDGKWMVKLAPLKASESLEMTISGKNKLDLKNVAVGEVWLASGQSNMEFPLRYANNAGKEIAASTDPSLRMFTVQRTAFPNMQTSVVGAWLPSIPPDSRDFSAVAYFFARELRKKLNVPVGIIHSSWGGTQAQAWTSRAALEANPDLKTQIIVPAENAAATYPAALEKYNAETLPAWQKAVNAAKAAGQKEPRQPPLPGGGPNDRATPSALFNGMIAPLIPYGIAGAIWYQGESNADQAKQYRTLFPTMIRDWRTRWNQGDFPFGFVQLANFQEQQLLPSDGGWAGLREAQLMTLSLPKTGMASAIDVGESYSIHPTNKQEVGRRLALWALATVYGQDGEYSGPLYDSMSTEGNKIRLRFTHLGGGLMAQDNSSRFAAEVLPRPGPLSSQFDVLQTAGLAADAPVVYNAQKVLTRREGAQIIASIDAKLAANNDANLETTQLAEGSDRAKVKGALNDLRRVLAPQIAELKTPNGDHLRGFAIAGADGQWIWGDAAIEGDTVVVSSPQVSTPVAVRYSWANNPNGNLYNKVGLPASPFRTDTNSPR
jgi:sialate O-acetylesterase